MKKMPVFGLLTAAIVAALTACAGAHDMADRVFIHGRIWTVNPARPWAEAVAVRDGRILAVGTTGEVRDTAGPKTESVDLRGAFVLPGFIDSHVHFVNGGFSLMNIQLRDASTKDEFIRRIADKAKSLPPGEWILNGDWDHENFRPVELPRKDWIDAVTPLNPVCVNRLDEHMILANSLALKIAGITKATPVPAGGEIVKNPATGEPTGILKDAAMDLVYAKIPEATPAQNRRAIEAAMSYAAAHGVTSVHDVSGEVGLDIYQDLLKEGNLRTRICFYVPVTSLDQVAGMKFKTGFGNEFLKFGGLKGFADGSLGSATAYFFEPFTDNPATSGLLHAQMFPEGVMETRVRTADRAGLQTAIHAIGDRANAMILDIYERVAAADGARDRRFRVEHAQHVRPADIARFGRLGVIASVQPYHLIDDGRWAEKKIGPERVTWTYPFKSFLDGGVRLAFGSDWPVAPMDPILGIYAAVTRRTLDDRHPDGWVPEQKISLEEAIKGFTWNGAFAEFAESVKGSLEPGKLADLVVLDRDLFSLRPEELKTANVRMTVCGGRVIFSK
jgi:predicted amidohydrolase YtcJ